MKNDGAPWVSTSGAESSKKAARFDLIPTPLLECIADRLEGGLPKAGHKWKKGLEDVDFVIDRTNHMQWHLSALMNGDMSEDDEWGHLGAIVFGCMVRVCAVRVNGVASGENLIEILTMKRNTEAQELTQSYNDGEDTPF